MTTTDLRLVGAAGDIAPDSMTAYLWLGFPLAILREAKAKGEKEMSILISGHIFFWAGIAAFVAYQGALVIVDTARHIHHGSKGKETTWPPPLPESSDQNDVIGTASSTALNATYRPSTKARSE